MKEITIAMAYAPSASLELTQEECFTLVHIYTLGARALRHAKASYANSVLGYEFYAMQHDEMRREALQQLLGYLEALNRLNWIECESRWHLWAVVCAACERALQGGFYHE